MECHARQCRRLIFSAQRRAWVSLALVAGLILSIVLPVLAADRNLQSTTGTSGLIMVDKVGGYVLFFDPATDKEIARFDPSDGPGVKPHEVAISPDHKTAYVSVYGDGVYNRNPTPGHSIAIFDLVERKMVGKIDISPYRAPHGIQVDSKEMLYVACDLDDKVLIINPKTRRMEAVIDVGGRGHWLALTPDESKLYVANQSDKPFVSVIDLKTRKMIGKVPIPGGGRGIVASPDGKTVVVAENDEAYLHFISTATDQVVDKIRVTGVEGGLYKVFYSADGTRILTCLFNGQINIVDAANPHAPQTVMKSDGTALMGFAFHVDGKTALVGNHGQGTVSRIDLDAGTVVNTFPAGEGVETLAYY